MSADNGIYIGRFTGGKHGYTYEYRVCEDAAIENCDKNDMIPMFLHEAYLVAYYGKSEVYNDHNDAWDRACELSNEIAKDNGFTEYGICMIDYDEEFPGISLEEANNIIDKYWNHIKAIREM